jgi:pyridoxine 5-phosphate synthase
MSRGEEAIRLGVNIDHVATLREARGEGYPSISDAAEIALSSGADQITIHLREDRRHIQDADVGAVSKVCQRNHKLLNLEMGVNEDIMDIAIAVAPDWVCLVPERREEMTTEGGVDLVDPTTFANVKRGIEFLRKGIPNVKISLFLQSDLSILEQATLLAPDAVEIHTGDYARAHLCGEEYGAHLESFKQAADYLRAHSIGVHAGHGLTDESLVPLLDADEFVEYNIGHWIICQSVFDGLAKVVQRINNLLISA